MRGPVEEPDVLLPLRDRLLQDADRGLVALGDEDRAVRAFEAGDLLLHVLELTPEDHLEVAGAVRAREGDEQLGQADLRRLLRLLHLRHHRAEHERQDALAALLLELHELLGRQVGVHEVLRAVVDRVELELELEQVLQQPLERADHAVGLHARPGDGGVPRLHHLVKERVVPLERLREVGEVLPLADVDGGDEVDAGALLALVRHDRRLEAPAAVVVLDEAEELLLLRVRRRGGLLRARGLLHEREQ